MSQYIFLDESGDLGFDSEKKNSQFFIITVLFTSNVKPLEKIIKSVHSGLRKTVKKFSAGILHAYKEKPVTRIRILKQLGNQNCAVMVIFLNKAKVYSKLQDEKHVLYNYVVNILLDRIMTKNYVDKTKPVKLIAAKRETNKFLNTNFKDYLQKQLKSNHSVILDIDIKTPGQEKALQLVDFASWAVFRKYELKDTSYYLLIKNIIKEESGLFT